MPQLDLRFQLYDTWLPSTTANVVSTLFQVTSGSDSTHNQQYTNMRGPGALPQTEKMVVDRIRVMQDKILPKADVVLMYFNALVEIRIADFSVLVLPLMQCIDHSAWSGAIIEATAVDEETVGPIGDGFMLDKPIVLPGAVPFKVLLTQGAALSGASQLKVILDGIYTLTTQG